jgi:YVTN family beta-propeller protein
MESKVMKKSLLFFAAVAALSLLASCAREDYAPAGSDNAAGNVQTLTACFAPGETKTAFVGGTYMWKTNDNIVVRSSNANGYSTFKYTGGDTNGEAIFTNTSEDVITYGQNSFAIYPAKTSGSGDSAYPKEEGGSLKPVLKDTYTWFDGNVEAPMLARVESGTPLEFKHLGGCLKVTYKNVPPKATKIMVYAPVVDADLLAAGKVSYKIHSIMNQTYNWTTAGGGFDLDPANVPYVKAYDHSGDYKITVNISAATAAQRTSDDGITAYIPLPVGPVEVDSKNVYPQLKIWLAFADGTEVPGSLRTATNVQIERAHIKPMPAISLTKYSVEVVAGTDNTNGDTDATGSSARLKQVRGLEWLDSDNLLLTQSNGADNSTRNLRKYNKTTNDVSTVVNLALVANNNNAIWQGELHGGLFYVINKGLNKVYTWNTSTNTVTDAVTIGNSPMCIRFNGDDAYVVSRNESKVYKLEGGLTGTKTTFFDFSTLNLGSTDGQTNWPVSLCFDADGNALVTVGCSKGGSPSAYMIYVIDSAGNVVNTIGKGGTVAGSFAAMVDGAKDKATFSANMNGLRLGPDGAIYLAERGAIRRITHSAADYSDAVVTTILGGGSSYITAVGATAALDWNNGGQDIIFDPSDSKVFYYTDMRYTLKKVTIE